MSAFVGAVPTCLTGPVNAIISAAGERRTQYTAGVVVGEALPDVELCRVASVDYIGEPLSAAHPNLEQRTDLVFEGRTDRVEGRKIFVTGTLSAAGERTAEAEGLFVNLAQPTAAAYFERSAGG